MTLKNLKICLLLLIASTFLTLIPIIKAPAALAPKTFQYPSPYWIIERQDYFGAFLLWDFQALDKNKTIWIFSWQINDVIEDNALFRIRDNAENVSFLKEVFNDVKEMAGFSNLGDFISDCKRLENYPVTINPHNRSLFLKPPIAHIDIQNNDKGNFTFTLTEWQQNIWLQIGFKTTITYSSNDNIITCIGGAQGSEIDFEDLYNADKDGTFCLQHRDMVNETDSDPINVTNPLRPTDYVELGGYGEDDLYFNITYLLGSISARIYVYGKDRGGTDQQSYRTITANGIYYLSLEFAIVYSTEVVVFTGTGHFSYDLMQGQWGVIWRNEDDNQYQFDARIVLGNATVEGITWFADSSKQIIFSDFLTSYQRFIEKTKWSRLRFGILEDETKKSTIKGVDFISLSTQLFHYIIYDVFPVGYGMTEIYSCSFKCSNVKESMLRIEGRMYNCLLAYSCVIISRPNADYFNVNIQKAKTNAISYPNGIWDRVVITDTRTSLYVRYSTTMKNMFARGCTEVFRASMFKYGDFWLINADSDTWHTYWSADSTNDLYRQYEYDLNVTDPSGAYIENANITLRYYGQGGGLIGSWLTFANSTIPTVTISKCFYNKAGGDTPYSYEPIEITVLKDGYATQCYNFTISEKTHNLIVLEAEAPSFSVGIAAGAILASIIVGIIAYAVAENRKR